MGFDNERVLNIQSVPADYFCPHCLKLICPNEALQTLCGHLYCPPCLSYVAATTKHCPRDGILVTEADSKRLVDSNKLLADTIGKVTVRCLYDKSGCLWQGGLSECITHSTACGSQIVHRQFQGHNQFCPAILARTQQADSSLTQSSAAATRAFTQDPPAVFLVAPATTAGAVTAPALASSSVCATTRSTMAVASYPGVPASTSQGQAISPKGQTAEQYQEQFSYEQYWQQCYSSYYPHTQQYEQYAKYQQAEALTQDPTADLSVAPATTAGAVTAPALATGSVGATTSTMAVASFPGAPATTSLGPYNPYTQRYEQYNATASQPFAMPTTQARASQVLPHVQPHSQEHPQAFAQHQHTQIPHQYPQQQQLYTKPQNPHAIVQSQNPQSTNQRPHGAPLQRPVQSQGLPVGPQYPAPRHPQAFAQHQHTQIPHQYPQQQQLYTKPQNPHAIVQSQIPQPTNQRPHGAPLQRPVQSQGLPVGLRYHAPCYQFLPVTSSFNKQAHLRQHPKSAIAKVVNDPLWSEIGWKTKSLQIRIFKLDLKVWGTLDLKYLQKIFSNSGVLAVRLEGSDITIGTLRFATQEDAEATKHRFGGGYLPGYMCEERVYLEWLEPPPGETKVDLSKCLQPPPEGAKESLGISTNLNIPERPTKKNIFIPFEEFRRKPGREMVEKFKFKAMCVVSSIKPADPHSRMTVCTSLGTSIIYGLYKYATAEHGEGRSWGGEFCLEDLLVSDFGCFINKVADKEVSTVNVVLDDNQILDLLSPFYQLDGQFPPFFDDLRSEIAKAPLDMSTNSESMVKHLRKVLNNAALSTTDELSHLVEDFSIAWDGTGFKEREPIEKSTAANYAGDGDWRPVTNVDKLLQLIYRDGRIDGGKLVFSHDPYRCMKSPANSQLLVPSRYSASIVSQCINNRHLLVHTPQRTKVDGRGIFEDARELVYFLYFYYPRFFPRLIEFLLSIMEKKSRDKKSVQRLF